MVFYGRLFEVAPDLEPMFRGARKDQARKMAQVLCVVVKSLDNPEQLLPSIRQLGERHAQYGVRPEQYKIVGGAFLWALARIMGDALTREARDGWEAAYEMLATAMQEAADDVTVEIVAA